MALQSMFFETITMKSMRVIFATLSSMVALILALPVWLLCVPFIVVYYLTAAFARLFEMSCIPWRDIVFYEPVIGWKPKPNLNLKYFAIDGAVCRLRTDSHGWAGTRSIAESDIVVFGDSFAFGYGVNLKRSFFEQITQPRIKAIGAPGYNMVQELILMRQLAAELEGKLVVWFICLDNDLYDNLRPNKPNLYKTPFVRSFNGTGDWKIVADHLSPVGKSDPPRQSPYYPMLAKFCTEGFFSERAFSACSYLIKNGRGICAEAGAELVVMTIPNRHQLSERGVAFLASHLPGSNRLDADYPDKRIGAICEQIGVRFVAAKKYLSPDDYKDRDPHWNESGHRRIAALMASLYRDYLSKAEGRTLAV
jgi:hypothetical protein